MNFHWRYCQIVVSFVGVDLELVHELKCFNIDSAAIFPEINAGGTPGPGTVNCPVKYKFFTFLLLIFGLKNAVCVSVLASP